MEDTESRDTSSSIILAQSVDDRFRRRKAPGDTLIEHASVDTVRVMECRTNLLRSHLQSLSAPFVSTLPPLQHSMLYWITSDGMYQMFSLLLQPRITQVSTRSRLNKQPLCAATMDGDAWGASQPAAKRTNTGALQILEHDGGEIKMDKAPRVHNERELAKCMAKLNIWDRGGDK